MQHCYPLASPSGAACSLPRWVGGNVSGMTMNFDAFRGMAPRSVYARFFGAPIEFAQAHTSAAPRSRCTCNRSTNPCGRSLSTISRGSSAGPEPDFPSAAGAAPHARQHGPQENRRCRPPWYAPPHLTAASESRRHHQLEAASVLVRRAIGDYAFWRYLSNAGVVAIFFGASLIIVTTLPPREPLPNHCQGLI